MTPSTLPLQKTRRGLPRRARVSHAPPSYPIDTHAAPHLISQRRIGTPQAGRGTPLSSPRPISNPGPLGRRKAPEHHGQTTAHTPEGPGSPAPAPKAQAGHRQMPGQAHPAQAQARPTDEATLRRPQRSQTTTPHGGVPATSPVALRYKRPSKVPAPTEGKFPLPSHLGWGQGGVSYHRGQNKERSLCSLPSLDLPSRDTHSPGTPPTTLRRRRDYRATTSCLKVPQSERVERLGPVWLCVLT